MLQKGDVAPPFQLLQPGTNVQSPGHSAAGGSLLLVFFKVSCPTCQFTLPFLNRLHRSEMTDTPKVIGASQNDAEETAAFVRQFGIAFPVLLDPAPKYVASNAFGIAHVPSLFLIDQDGRIAWALEGFHKVELETLAHERYYVPIFQQTEVLPAMKAG